MTEYENSFREIPHSLRELNGLVTMEAGIAKLSVCRLEIGRTRAIKRQYLTIVGFDDDLGGMDGESSTLIGLCLKPDFLFKDGKPIPEDEFHIRINQLPLLALKERLKAQEVIRRVDKLRKLDPDTDLGAIILKEEIMARRIVLPSPYRLTKEVVLKDLQTVIRVDPEILRQSPALLLQIESLIEERVFSGLITKIPGEDCVKALGEFMAMRSYSQMLDDWAFTQKTIVDDPNFDVIQFCQEA